MVIWLPVAAAVLMIVAEWIHARRIRRMRYLVFGPSGYGRKWTAFAPAIRVIAAGAVVWGLVVLMNQDGSTLKSAAVVNAQKNQQHIVIALDVSPSMHLDDAGKNGKQTRAVRAGEVLRSILDRMDRRSTRVSVIAFYTNARPVVIDTVDDEVIDNILNDLPLQYAFESGKTNMYAAVATSKTISERWRNNSATFILIGDGDTLPAEQTVKLPTAFRSSLVIGVGNPFRGTFIDDHSSRQDSRSLQQLAAKLNGKYFEANTQHVSTKILQQLVASPASSGRQKASERAAALAALMLGSTMLAVLPFALTIAGGATSNTTSVRSTSSPNGSAS